MHGVSVSVYNSNTAHAQKARHASVSQAINRPLL